MISWRAPKRPTTRRCSRFPRGPGATGLRRIGCAATPFDNLGSRSIVFLGHTVQRRKLSLIDVIITYHTPKIDNKSLIGVGLASKRGVQLSRVAHVPDENLRVLPAAGEDLGAEILITIIL